jgi:hypothetical protein
MEGLNNNELSPVARDRVKARAKISNRDIRERKKIVAIFLIQISDRKYTVLSTLSPPGIPDLNDA